jgi:hypothetical protein
MGTIEEERFHTTEASPWMRPFVPPRFLRTAYLQTIVGNLLPRTHSLPEPETQRGELRIGRAQLGLEFEQPGFRISPVKAAAPRVGTDHFALRHSPEAG